MFSHLSERVQRYHPISLNMRNFLYFPIFCMLTNVEINARWHDLSIGKEGLFLLYRTDANNFRSLVFLCFHIESMCSTLSSHLSQDEKLLAFSISFHGQKQNTLHLCEKSSTLLYPVSLLTGC